MDTSLEQLATLYGIETSYQDATGQRRDAAPETLRHVLQVFGAPLATATDAADPLRYRRQELARRCLEPVTVAWDGRLSQPLTLRLSAGPAAPLGCRLELEGGGLRNWSVSWADLALHERHEVEGVVYEARRLPLAEPLPLGLHRLVVDLPHGPWESLLLAAPVQAHVPAADGRAKGWGVFIPLYALHSERSWGAGDFTDLAVLLNWLQVQGGGTVATLPLLAAFLDEPFEPSPYSPASRLFWNEFYIDVEAVPEWHRCAAARAVVTATDFQAEVQALRREPLVDYGRQMALKRQVLAELARHFFAEPGDRLQAFRRFVADHPQAEDYARFRAVGERRRCSWWVWPAPLRDGTVRAGDYDEEARRYHLYVQWLADEQLGALAARARTSGPGLYLDLPLGVNSDSYDVWRERSSFALGVAGGAPPDPFFTGGQDWGFPPLHPERIRQTGYRYLSACLRHHMQYAGLLRVDHLMGLHRLFWVPNGMAARDGVYVRYPAEELYALFCLESRRHRTLLVGEDLGTVPPEVRPAMARHRVSRTYVVQYALDAESAGLDSIPADSVASVNTHDMPTFAAFWQGLDLADRRDLGLLDEVTARSEADKRQGLRDEVVHVLRNHGFLGDSDDPTVVLRALLAHLSAAPDRLVLATVEDLWLETRPQNVPGTWRERPNWQRRARYPFETWSRLPEVLRALREMDRPTREPRGSRSEPPSPPSARGMGPA
jgi:4-alpha-glucanotransferase